MTAEVSKYTIEQIESLELAPGTVVRLARRGVATVLSPEEPEEDEIEELEEVEPPAETPADRS